MATGKVKSAISKLIWENPTPTQGMGAQSGIAIDASKYTMFLVVVGSYLYNVPFGNIVTKGIFSWVYNFQNSPTNTRARNITINDNSLSFSNGYANFSNGTGTASTADANILAIYGLF